MKRVLAVMLLAGMGTAHAATGSITVSGTINEVFGTSVGEQVGNTITATFYVSLDPINATSVDTDLSDNAGQYPLSATAFYTFNSGAFSWSMSSSGGGSYGSTNIYMLTENDYVELPYNSGQPFDVFTIGGFSGTQGDAFEAELILAKQIMFSGTDLPGSISPDLNTYVGAFITGNVFQGGVLVGEFNAPITSMTVSAALMPVPEPEAYAMMLAGLGLVGAVARRRRQAEV